MVALSDAVLVYQPLATFGLKGTCLLADDGAGVHIAHWDSATLGPQPTNQQLAAIDLLPLYKQRACDAIDLQTQAAIAQGFAFDGQQFSLSMQAQSNWTNLMIASALLTFPLEVSTINEGQYALNDAAHAQEFYGSAIMAAKACIDAGRAKKLAVMACATQTQLDSL